MFSFFIIVIMEYGYLLILFVLLFNTFFIGKLFQFRFANLKISYSYFLSFFFLVSLFSVLYLPFYIVSQLSDFFIYGFLIMQLGLIFTYIWNFKKYVILFSFDWIKFVAFLTIFSIMVVGYFVFFYNKLTFQLLDIDRPIYTNDFSAINISYLSFFNHLIFAIFLQLKMSINDFYVFNNYVMPVIVMLLVSTSIYAHFFDNDSTLTKKYLISFASACCLSTIIFNVNNFKINLFNDSFVYMILFNVAVFIFLKKNYVNIETIIFALSVFIFSLMFISTSNIMFVVFALLMFIFALFYQKTPFATFYLSRLLIYLVAGLSIFFLTTYSYSNPLTITYSVVFFAIFLVLHLFSSIYKKNNQKKYVNAFVKTTEVCSQYYSFLYILIFAISCLLIVFLLINQLDVRPYLWFINNKINYNITNPNILTSSNTLFDIFYFFMFALSTIILLSTFKKLKNYKANFIMLNYFIFMLFNPLVTILIEEYKNPLDSYHIFNRLDIIYNFEIILFLVYCFMQIDKIKKWTNFVKLDQFKQDSLLKQYGACLVKNTNIFYQNYQIEFVIKMTFPIGFVFCSLLFHLV